MCSCCSTSLHRPTTDSIHLCLCFVNFIRAKAREISWLDDYIEMQTPKISAPALLLGKPLCTGFATQVWTFHLQKLNS